MEFYIWNNFNIYLQSWYKYFESLIYSNTPENQNTGNLIKKSLKQDKLTNLEISKMLDDNENYKDEISNLNQNLKICNDWYKDEIDRLKTNCELKSFDSNSLHYPKDNLCKKLKCSDSSRSMLIKQMQCKVRVKEFLDIQKENAQLIKNINEQKEIIHKQIEKIAHQDGIIDNQDIQLNSYIEKYKESNHYIISLLANNSTLNKRIKLLRVKIGLIILGIIIITSIGYISLNWVSSSKSNQHEKENKGLKRIFSVNRGGAIAESKNETFMTSIEYACILVHLEKIKRILNSDSEPVCIPKRKLRIPRLRFNPSFIAYIGISLLTLGEIKTINGIQRSASRDSISIIPNSISSESTDLNQSCSKVKLGSSILSFKNGRVESSKIAIKEEKLVRSNHTRVKYKFKTSSLNRKFKSRKRAKLVRLSNLPPIDSFSSKLDFYENDFYIYKNQINSSQNNYKIRNSISD